MPTSRTALLTATAVATVLQILMVVAGHLHPEVAALFGPLGTALSLVAGVIYALLSREAVRPAAMGGAIAGAACGVLGVFVSFALGDVPALVFVIAAVSGVVAGAIGGAGTAYFTQRTATA